MRHLATCLALSVLPAMGASAGVVKEVRFGVTDHNICVANCDNANNPKAVNPKPIISLPCIYDRGILLPS